MTSSDDDLSWVLRRELNAEAARLAAAQDGLSQIRARLGSRPSVPVWGPLWGGLRVDAERYGLRARHLAAEAADWIAGLTGRIPFPGRRDRTEGRTGAQPGLGWLRPVLAVAAVCIFAGTAAAVPGLRHAISNIGSSGSGHTASVTGHGGGSVQGHGSVQGGGNGPAGGQVGVTASASPSPSTSCPPKPLPSAKASPAGSGAAVSPTVPPAQSSPATTPATTPTPAQTPTSPTGSSGPTPTDTSGAPLGGSSEPPTSTSSHLRGGIKSCGISTLKGSASAAAAGASQIPTAIPTPLQTSGQVEQPAVTPESSSASAPATATSPASSSDPDTPSASSTSSSGSPWSQGFETARACRHHPHPGCPSA
jgi:hypothetical protein